VENLKSVAGRYILVPIFLVVSVMLFAGSATAAYVDHDAAEREDQAEYRAEDIDKTIDKAIKVLTVLREELKEEDKSLSADAAAIRQDSAAVTAGKWIGRINRMWKNVKKAVSEDAGADVPVADIIDAKELSGRLGQAIDIMTSIKSELEKESISKGE
jgi:uncharacterized membrane protein